MVEPDQHGGWTDYSPPLTDITLALNVVGFDNLLALPVFAHLDRTSIDDALIEFARFASQVIAPTDRIGDLEGCNLDPDSGLVTTPSSFDFAYKQYVENGWGGVHVDRNHGGGGLPALVGFALQEMMASANLALSLNPALTHSAVELLLEWGSADQHARYLRKLITGEWCGTMNLTEPGAGSDLSEIATQAVRDDGGLWRISGTKIFITWGDHDLAENIVHLVLARTPGSDIGTKGLSLFLVPKFLVDNCGNVGRRNSARCVRLEEKLGIHGSPTCTMQFDDAIGELVGDEQSGIRAMFTMMNAARLSIGLQGPSVAERAYQHAYRYAQERIQGRAEGVSPPQRSPLRDHPDVRRMLLSMRTSILAARLLLYTATANRDIARHSTNYNDRVKAQAYVDLLTPVAKAWSTDIGFSAASTGLQILGGSGYVEESGMAQRLRDSRIAPIYEGTNGIQAIDLVIRKLPRDGGRWIRALLDDIGAAVNRRPLGTAMLNESFDALSDAFATLDRATDVLLTRIDESRNDALAGATSYLELFGLTVGGKLMIKRASQAAAAYGDGSVLARRASMESEFFATEFVARARGLSRPILSGAGRLSDLL